MGFLPIAFATPAILWGLLALPVIWWLLRLTPPKPQTEVFPPLKILARALKREETPSQSPWWLTLLRLVMAALVILALAEPILNPRERLPANGNGLALVIDNGWASAKDWDRRVATAERLINDAEDKSVLILMAFTAEKANAQIGPFTAQEARDRLNAIKPRPIPVDRPAVYERIANALQEIPGASVAVLSDGLAGSSDEAAFKTLLGRNPANLIWIAPEHLDLVGMTAADNQIDRLTITAARSDADVAPRFMTAGAFDTRGRRIADAAITFRPGQKVASGDMIVPFELRNDFVSVSLDGETSAAATRVLDDTQKRRRVGLLSQTPADEARLLLSPLYYIRRALEPFADVVEPSSPDLLEAIPELLAQKPAVIAMGDVGTIPETVRGPLIDWLKEGGTLVRFASSNLLSSGDEEEVLPVKLRLGERLLGGALSWTEPQPIAEFPVNGPFADLSPPTDVTVSRQVLAEPTPDIVEKTWATLADGTPLVTGDRRGKGMLVLFHITPQATWSNLPISGTFVEMLRRVVQLSRNQGVVANSQSPVKASLPPYRMISADGQLMPPDGEARPLEPSEKQPGVTVENPPGLYGTVDGAVAHNLLPADAQLLPLAQPQTSVPVVVESYAADQSFDMKGPLLLAALMLFLIDALIVLWLAGLFNRRNYSRPATAGAVALLLVFGLSMLAAPNAFADDSKPGDTQAIDAISATRLAYVVTGDPAVDAISRAGLTGLTAFLIEKTALEPAEPAGVDIGYDELSFYPIIYWPIDANAAMPSQEALARIDAYMKQGGTVLFDTRDQYVTTLETSTSPATQRLRDILANMNVPPLEPVPDDHVLTKAFFILRDFQGRFTGSPLWVAASLDATNEENRPVRTGDGVSPIMITGNDFAGAWAVDANGEPMLPTVPGDPMQRIYALRSGVNIVMYMLTGNYKSDQVHVPDLLERLGQ
jgi:hypothetical protein